MLGASNLHIILDEIRLLPVQELVDIKVFGQTIAFLTQRSASDRHEKDSRKALIREGREKGARVLHSPQEGNRSRLPQIGS